MNKFGQLFFSLVGVALLLGACATQPEQKIPEAIALMVSELEVAPQALKAPVFPSEFLGDRKAPETRSAVTPKPRIEPKAQPQVESKPARSREVTGQPSPTQKTPEKAPKKDPYANAPKPETPLNLGCQNWTPCPAIHQSELNTKVARLNGKKELIEDPAITPKQRLRLKMELSKLQTDIDDLRSKLREKCMDC